jgi:lysine N6-hydroxylase
MNKQIIHDLIGIGIGPFNLGLAALANNIPNLDTKFFDRNTSFNWHPGLLMPETRLQVPFFADLVTPVDPTSRFSYMNFLKTKGRMFRFAIQENNFITRFEYNEYCQWVIAQLPNLHFGFNCEAIHFNSEKECYDLYFHGVDGHSYLFHGKKIVVGVGTVPSLPDCLEGMDLSEHPMIFHSTDYLFKKEKLLKQKRISIIGSGQSAAEIFYDLLQYKSDAGFDNTNVESISWLTRAEYIFPMDNSKFAFEMTSPDYINYFYNLPGLIKQKVQSSQNHLYKGVNKELIDAIYQRLYLNAIHDSRLKVNIRTNTEFDHIRIENQSKINLLFYHLTKGQFYEYPTDVAIFATGYKNVIPEFLNPVKALIQSNEEGNYDLNKNYSVDTNDSIFVQNADLRSHGFNSADLGIGPYRNVKILNTILQKEYINMEENIAFQNFAI